MTPAAGSRAARAALLVCWARRALAHRTVRIQRVPLSPLLHRASLAHAASSSPQSQRVAPADDIRAARFALHWQTLSSGMQRARTPGGLGALCAVAFGCGMSPGWRMQHLVFVAAVRVTERGLTAGGIRAGPCEFSRPPLLHVCCVSARSSSSPLQSEYDHSCSWQPLQRAAVRSTAARSHSWRHAHRSSRCRPLQQAFTIAVVMFRHRRRSGRTSLPYEGPARTTVQPALSAIGSRDRRRRLRLGAC